MSWLNYWPAPSLWASTVTLLDLTCSRGRPDNWKETNKGQKWSCESDAFVVWMIFLQYHEQQCCEVYGGFDNEFNKARNGLAEDRPIGWLIDWSVEWCQPRLLRFMKALPMETVQSVQGSSIISRISSSSDLVYQFPVDAVTNDHRRSGFTQTYSRTVLQVRSLKIEMLSGLVPSGASRAESIWFFSF